MYGIFSNMCPIHHPNVGKFIIHGAFGNQFRYNINMYNISDWWFGTFYFSIYWGQQSQLTNSIIFQRGRSTTNQICTLQTKLWLFVSSPSCNTRRWTTALVWAVNCASPMTLRLGHSWCQNFLREKHRIFPLNIVIFHSYGDVYQRVIKMAGFQVPSGNLSFRFLEPPYLGWKDVEQARFLFVNRVVKSPGFLWILGFPLKPIYSGLLQQVFQSSAGVSGTPNKEFSQGFSRNDKSWDF